MEKLKNESDSWDLSKKLLFIDTDNNFLQDLATSGREIAATPRYHLHEFLTRIYKHYNIVLWTSHSLSTLKEEMKSLGICDNSQYKISSCLDRQLMTNACAVPGKVKFVKHPRIIWKKFPNMYSAKNTVIISSDRVKRDDKHGLNESLPRLSEYLEYISNVTDFTTLDHSNWEEQEKRRIYQRPLIENYISSVKDMINNYKVKQLNPLRPDKNLLVLDIDNTIFGMRNNAPWKRPHLDDFLKRSYEHYDIAIWSARKMKGIDLVMHWLNVTNHEDYKIAFQMDGAAMIMVEMTGLVSRAKPLHVIWGMFPQFSPRNTIMLDDQKANFLMNPQSGLLIKVFPGQEDPREDDELLKLTDYLRLIAEMKQDFTGFNHQNWRNYILS
ncbi:ubiquitin-like domain-containing CTD phosphatase 1 [Diachasma alloeum]|uniref:ubiquitin-like domain-containing CTD phosphatase 1 n=1 Tax=Diachasma alloeum TaxID=454923 RepID=UPI0007381486|nr:ubiquitin-like domain-containing CTD phosphatase 1 [Diachasma alloeum]